MECIQFPSSGDGKPATALVFGYNTASGLRYGGQPWGRRKSVSEAGLRTISTSYDDLRRIVRTTSPLDANRSLVTATTHDWLGRAIRTGSTNDAGQHPASDNAGGGIRTESEVRYPATANDFSYQLASNPYNTTGDSTMGWTRTTLDRMGRPVEVQTYSGSERPWPWDSNGTSTGTATTSCNAEVTTFTDPAGKVRTTYVDGLGRLVKVVEAPTIENYTTSYRYDALDNLAGVCHGGTFSGETCSGGQSRTFDYSSLGRLYSATNPEKDSATTYTYDRNGNLVTRVDGGVTTTMVYDARDRVTSKTYSGGDPATAPVYYCYDGTQTTDNCTGAPSGSGYLYGRLTMVSSNGTDNRYQYDALGRVTAHTQVTDSTPYPFTYEYNLADQVTKVHYPSGRDVLTTYNGAGRPDGVTGYASGLEYWPHGGVSEMTLGNGVAETTQYDSRLRMSSLEAKTADETTLLGLNYTYYNNSNVATQQITGSGLAASQSYGYDGVNRLASASEDGTVWSRVFGYDARGNGWVDSWAGIQPDNFTPRSASWFNAKNQLVNAGLNINYDTAGNQKAIGAYTFKYDGENRLREVTINGASVTYAYDGEGRRVKRTAGGQTTVYVYNAMGELMAEYGGETNGGGLQYLTADSLGSTRLVTGASGAVVSRLDYLPFGEEIPARVGGRGPQWSASSGMGIKFTGKERDGETGLDYFGARYYSGAQGRFTSADRPFADQNPLDPQSWNLHSYARNNPLRFVDPTGEAIQLTGTTEEDREKELAAIRAGLVNSKVAGNLYVNAEKDKNGKDTGRYFVGIRGDAADFVKAGSLESGLAEVIGSQSIVQFGFGETVTERQTLMESLLGGASSDVGGRYGGAVTLRSDATLSGHIQTVVDPSDIRGRLGEAPTPTLGETVAHELIGHALGFIRNPMIGGARTNRMAVDAENAARSRGGISRGRRTTHFGGFPK